MLRNQLLLAWRNLVKRAGISVINILGLATGIAACVLIYLYVHYELTYDLYNNKADRIVRVTTTIKGPSSTTALATAPLKLGDILRTYPEVENVVRLNLADGGVVRSRNDNFKETHFFETDTSVFSILAFTFIEGRAAGSLDGPHSIVLTRSIATKYFGKAAALGKTLVFNGQPRTVTGVVEDRPSNSDLTIDALLSANLTKDGKGAWMDDDFSACLLVLFRGKPDLKAMSQKLQYLSIHEIQPLINEQGEATYNMLFELERLQDVHFSQGKLGDPPKGNRSLNYVFALLALFILVIALLNYINLSTAKAVERAKEVGIRKVNGARRGQLVRQFLLESLLLVTLSWIVALGLVALGLPVFNRILLVRLSLPWATLARLGPVVFLLTVFLAGAYPALVLSSFQPSEVLKGSWRHGTRGLFLRRIITVAQFTITAVLITGTIVIYAQMRYIDHKDLGFQKDQIIALTTPPDSVMQGSVTALTQTLKEEPAVHGVSTGSSMQMDGLNAIANVKAGTGTQKQDFLCDFFYIDPAFLPLMQIHLSAGRNLSDSLSADKMGGFIVNQAFVDRMGWRSPLGEPIEGFGHKGRVTGVVHNFFYKSLHKAVEPLVMIYNTFPIGTVLIKAPPSELPRVQRMWKGYFPSLPLDYTFLDKAYAAQYDKDRASMALFSAFTLLAIFVSCLGLYGLVSLVVVQRTKEIGVRKVLGAGVSQLVLLLSRDFMRLVVLAGLIAIPIAVVAAQRWLEAYAYHTRLSWWMFAVPLVLTLLIALSATGYRVVRAALANPVRSLRAD